MKSTTKARCRPMHHGVHPASRPTQSRSPGPNVSNNIFTYIKPVIDAGTRSLQGTEGPITFIAPPDFTSIDVQTALCTLQSRFDTIGDTSIVSQSVTNNRCAPNVAPALAPPHTHTHLQIANAKWRHWTYRPIV